MPSRQGHIINGVHCFQSLFTCRIVELLNFSMGFNNIPIYTLPKMFLLVFSFAKNLI